MISHSLLIDIFQRAEATRAREDLKDCIQHLLTLKSRDVEEESHRSSMATEPASNVSQNTKGLHFNAFATPEKSSHPAMLAATSVDIEQRREATPSTQVTEETSESARFLDDQSIASSFSSDGYPRRNLALCFLSQRGKEKVEKGPAFERLDDDIEKKRAPLFRRRQKKKAKEKSTIKQSAGRLTSSQRAQVVNKLNQNIAANDREAAELRTRLHSITRYYDNTVASLQQNADSNNAEYEADMINQLSFLDREKKTVLADLHKKEKLALAYKANLAKLAGYKEDDNVIQEKALV